MEPKRRHKDPMQCECATWGSDFIIMNEHHINCEMFDVRKVCTMFRKLTLEFYNATHGNKFDFEPFNEARKLFSLEF